MTEHILVTGSAGRIGQAAVRGLTAAGLPVVGFDLRPTPGLPPDQCVVGTLTDGELIRKAASGARCVIHLAATPDDARFPLLVKARDGFGSRHIYRAENRAQLEFFLDYTTVPSLVT